MLTRRQFLKSGAALSATPTLVAWLAACATSTRPPARRGAPIIYAPASMEMVWWGNADRASRTYKAIGIFQNRHQQYQIAGAYRDWSVYWSDLDSRLSQGTPPDIIQMDLQYVDKYRESQTLLELSPYVPSTISLADVDKSLVAQGSLHGFYGVPIAGNMASVIYNNSLLQQSGASFPKLPYTWSDFADFCVRLARDLPQGVWPIESFAGNSSIFEAFIRQHGHEIYTPDGGVNFSVDEARAWYQYWADLIAAGGVAPYSVSHWTNGALIQSQGIVNHRVVMVMTWSNFVEQYASVMGGADELQLAAIPNGPKGSSPGSWVKVSQLLSIYSGTRYPSQAAQFLQFWLHDLAANQALGLDRGTPVSMSVAEGMSPHLTPPQQVEVEFMAAEASSVSTKSVFDPPGSGIIQTQMFPIADALAQAQITVTQAADQLVRMATTALQK